MKKKIEILTIILCTLTIILLSIFIYKSSLSFLYSQIEKSATTDFSNLESELTVERLENFSITNNKDILLIDNSYKIVYSSENLKGNYFSSDILEAKKYGYSYALKGKDDNSGIVFTKKINVDNSIYLLSIEYPIIDISTFKLIIIISIITILISFIVLYLLFITLFTHSRKKSIRQLAHYTRASYRGEINIINRDSLNDEELGNLANDFNKLIIEYRSLMDFEAKKYSKISSLLTYINIGVVISDENNQVSLVNDKALNLIGLSKKDVLFQENTNFILSDIKRISTLVNQDKEKRKADITGFNESIIEVEYLPLYNKYKGEKYLGVIIILRDVTEKRKLQSSRDDFVSNVSHELRTPLTIISGYSQLLSNNNEAINSEDKQIAIKAINSESKHLEHLIQELLILSRIDKGKSISKGKFSPYNSIDLEKELFEKIVSKKNLILIESGKRQNLSLFGNEMYFRVIFHNLLDNAIKYSYNKGKIIIKTEVKNNYFVLSILDEGPGIEEKERDKIFERFYRIEKSRNRNIAGSGLGLSIVKDFVKQLNGSIEIDSNQKSGTVFTVSFEILKEK